ncbi:MFS transporter [Pseudonocardiaceae bacterium YIM PH 21723]|nr:MFS transporter [Pseudonocardiaceae bacterium YIM PH 21723]
MTAASTQPDRVEKVGVRKLAVNKDFRKLVLARIAVQWGEGLFQASLGGAVVFNPEREANPTAVALAFTVLLLPYSVIGPFAGALLDRWDRRQVLLVANLIRIPMVLLVAATVGLGYGGVPLYTAALLAAGTTRFILAGLSASLPHVVSRENLVEANAAAATIGAITAVVGGSCAILLRGLVGAGNQGSGWVTVVSAVGSALAVWAVLSFRRSQLGPDEVHEAARAVVAIAHGLGDGVRAAARTPSVAAGFVALIMHRLSFGAMIVAGLLMMRNYFTDSGPWRAGMGGVGEVLLFAAAGIMLAALVTPWLQHRLGQRIMLCGALGLSAVAQLVLVVPAYLPLLLAGAFVIAGTGQVIKLCVDTAVQRDVADELRGRVFALYDTLLNVIQVAAAALAALVLPDNGVSYPLLVGAAVVYLLGIPAYLVIDRRPA